MKELCDLNCNICPIGGHPNMRALTVILERLLRRFGDEVETIVAEVCPNMTCCFDCRVDDFCHIEGCELEKEAKKKKGKKKK